MLMYVLFSDPVPEPRRQDRGHSRSRSATLVDNTLPAPGEGEAEVAMATITEQQVTSARDSVAESVTQGDNAGGSEITCDTQLPGVEPTTSDQCLNSDGGHNSEHSEEGTDQPSRKRPNDLLFEIFLDSLSQVHDREIHLSLVDCERFGQLVRERDRDKMKHPVPFTYEPCTNTEHYVGEPHPFRLEDRLEEQHRSESSLSIGTSASLTSTLIQSQVTSSSSFTPSQTLPRLPTQKLSTPEVRPGSGLLSPVTVLSKAPDDVSGEQDPEEDHAESDRSRTPHWRCFTRSLNSTHVLLCFVPASFTDLELLIGKEEAQETMAMDPTPAVSQQDSGRVDAVEADLEVVLSHLDLEVPPTTLDLDQETKKDTVTMVTGREKEDSVTPAVSPELGESVTTETHPKAATLPVYVYNCPLASLGEQLVNKWTYQRPEDIFEDLTFKVTDDSEESSDRDRGSTMPRSPLRASREDGLRSGADREGSVPVLSREGSFQDDPYADDSELKGHCTMVSETFFRAFVKGWHLLIVVHFFIF